MRYLIPVAVAVLLSVPPGHAQEASLWRGCGEFEAWRIAFLGTEDFADEAATADCGAPKEPEELLVGCTRVIGRSTDTGILGNADFNRALARIVLGDLDGAIADVNRLLPSDDDSDAYDMRGVARYCGGDLEAALADLNAALAIWPENEVALADRARIYLAMDDLDRALSDARRAAEIEPDNSVAFLIIGVASERTGDMAAAAQAYDDALEAEFFCDCGAIDFDAVEAAYDRIDAATE